MIRSKQQRRRDRSRRDMAVALPANEAEIVGGQDVLDAGGQKIISAGPTVTAVVANGTSGMTGFLSAERLGDNTWRIQSSVTSDDAMQPFSWIGFIPPL